MMFGFKRERELLQITMRLAEFNETLVDRNDRILKEWRDTIDTNSAMLQHLHEGARLIDELKKERDSFGRRLQHLVSNPDIAAYDQLDPLTGKYLLDINKPLYEQQKKEK